MRAELVVRGGMLVDGSGGAPFAGDIAMADGKIVAVGRLDGVDTAGAEQIDAAGCIVTPGFVDIHTHYDGQAIWSDRLTPSSVHGVTTVVVGNCGVGFAPCRRTDHDVLIRLMEGVEDIPGVVMAEGLAWNWESFGEYLDALDARPRDIDVAAYVPHSPLRVYVMGQRAIDREPASDEDLERMRTLVRDGIAAGAVGCATSRLFYHRASDGGLIPTYDAGERELETLALGMADAGGGLLQLVPNLVGGDVDAEIALIGRIAGRTGMPVTFTSSASADPAAVTRPIAAFRAAGLDVTAQVFPRPVGMVLGLGLSWNPFSFCPSFVPLATLSAAERAARMGDRQLRAALLAEEPDISKFPLARQTRNFDQMFPLVEGFDYEPAAERSVAALAAAAGVPPLDYAYDALREEDGAAMLFVAMGNYRTGTLDPVRAMMDDAGVILGLGDGGAHYGLICDASFPTTILSHWVRDRAHGRIPLAQAVHALTRRPAEVAGLRDRGLLSPGYKADVNVIAPDEVRLHKPVVAHDLPAGGRRLMQTASGYRATIVDGRVTYRDGAATGALPGRLVRGRRGDPVATPAIAAE